MKAHSFIHVNEKVRDGEWSMGEKIETRVEEIARGLLIDLPELELVDVEYVRERDWYCAFILISPAALILRTADCSASVLKRSWTVRILSRTAIFSKSHPLDLTACSARRVILSVNAVRQLM